jgi:murein DD-endopeptidase MepM/ murein hydrolase activator NlpD
VAALSATLSAVLLGCAEPGARPLHPQHPPLELRGEWVVAGEGDTPAALASRFDVPLDDLTELNDLDAEAVIPAGTKVFVPRWGKRGAAEREPRPAGRPRPPPTPLAGRARATFKLSWPVKGTVSSRFGPRGGKRHEGIDIIAPQGTPVKAAAAGEVVYSGNGLRGFGNLVILLHEGRFLTVYAHNAQNLVKERTYVDRGQSIATVGTTGHSTAPHLHFEVRLGDVPQDPELFLEAR